ncbi:hypothetical protein GOP47_0030157 [Adiantum capillus-veneris]|nr:hypothetical protein GOP47_0030157 [Adiantum capillus-veneris]
MLTFCGSLVLVVSPCITTHVRWSLDTWGAEYYRQVKLYLRSSSLRRATLKALAKTLPEDDLFYLWAQFLLLKPSENGRLSLENCKSALTKHATKAMKESQMFDMIVAIDALRFKKMDFEEFCAAACSIFEREANRVVVIEDLVRELGIPSSVLAHVVLHDWIRHSDGKLSFFGFTNLLCGMPPLSGTKPYPGR